MDLHLQNLKRAAQADGSAENWQRYAAALERASGFGAKTEGDPIQAWVLIHWHDCRPETYKVIFSAHQPTVEQVLAADSDDYRYKTNETGDEILYEELGDTGARSPIRDPDGICFEVARWRRAKRLYPDQPYFAFFALEQDGSLEEEPNSYWGYEHGLSLEGPFPITEPLRQIDDLPFTDDENRRQIALGNEPTELWVCTTPFYPWAMSF